jgi:hypothetical protein
MDVSLKRGFLQSEYAVDSPKTPLPTIRIEVGISTVGEEAIVKLRRKNVQGEGERARAQ